MAIKLCSTHDEVFKWDTHGFHSAIIEASRYLQEQMELGRKPVETRYFRNSDNDHVIWIRWEDQLR